ncbi:MAG: SDR family oxidoreductase [Pseudomonadota bacterium]
MDMELKGKSVVVTGGGSNIGQAIVLGFAEEGANITIGDIDEVQARKVADLALKKGASGVQVVKADVTDLDQVRAMFDAAATKFGAIDNLVNNVGWDQLIWFAQTSPEFWEKVIKINYLSVLNCTRVALDYMIPRRSGSIVSVSSDASRQGEPREAVYAGTKAAVNAFIKTIAREHGRDGIRCNVVCPGVTVPEVQTEVGATSMWANKDGAFTPDTMFTPEQLEKVARALPLRKVGRPRDIANAVVFLSSSSRAGHVTGQILSASGGYSMIG